MAFGTSPAAEFQALQTRAKIASTLWSRAVLTAILCWIAVTVWAVWHHVGTNRPELQHVYFGRWVVCGILTDTPFINRLGASLPMYADGAWYALPDFARWLDSLYGTSFYSSFWHAAAGTFGLGTDILPIALCALLVAWRVRRDPEGTRHIRGLRLITPRQHNRALHDGPLKRAIHGRPRGTHLGKSIIPEELGSTHVIPDAPLPPGDVFTVGYDADDARYTLFRIQCSVTPGNGRFSLVGAVAKRIRESGRMAYDYLRTSGRKIGIDRDLGDYDINIQLMSHGPSGDAPDLGMAFYIALLSAILGRSIGAQLVVLGQMSIHGVLLRVDGLGDKLRVAMDAGARRVLIPTENSRDFASLPPEILDKLRIEFYSEPSQAAFKALAE